MDTNAVVERFKAFGGFSDTELSDWLFLCDDAAGETADRTVENTDNSGTSDSLLVQVAAALAFYRYAIIQSVNSISFRAGDLSVNPRISVEKAKLLLNEAEKAAGHLLRPSPDFSCDFAFRTVDVL